MINYGLRADAKSMIDENVQPESVGEVIRYLPRALQVALFVPFPSAWFDHTSVQRLVASAETAIGYLCFPGVLVLLCYNRKPSVFLVLYFACFFLTIYGFAESNLGTLYRHRYGYWFLVVALGILGWFTGLEKSGRLKWLRKTK